jgi:hypothetical protein
MGRVGPRHGHRGRPLNKIVRQHQNMSTLTIITIAVVLLFCLNSIVVVYRKRRRGVAATPMNQRKLTAVDVGLGALLVALLLVGVAAPKVAPESGIGQFIVEVGFFVYVAWCIMGTSIIGVLLTLTLRHRPKR